MSKGVIKMNKQELFDKFIECMGRFAEIRAVAALRDGFIMTTPFTICGSVFLLLANLPIPGYAEFMAGLFGPEWTAPLNAVSGATFNVLAFIAVLAITYKYVEAEGCDAIMASILALIISYTAIAIGFMNPFSAVQVPWTTPPIIAGLLLNGWQGAVVQIIIIAMSTAVYFPFIRAQDRAMLAEEQGDGGAPQDAESTDSDEGEPALHH